MQLIGMLDSPYVRRVAISLRLMAIPFEHRPLSVFRNFEDFAAINPAVKAPTLVCDDGVVLMDSTLILDYLSTLDQGRHPLLPSSLAERREALRVNGLALAAAEKAVQLVYEIRLRPPDKQHAPWLERVRRQLLAVWSELEAGLQQRPFSLAALDLAGVTCAVAWRFYCEMVPDAASTGDFPLLREWSRQAEAHPAFLATPFE
jgi:glutathione S-transferase